MFIFHLGFNEQLALLELETVLSRPAQRLAPHQYLVDLPNLSQLNTLAHRLGGLVKVTRQEDGKLIWHHQAKAWYRRDRLKPYADPHKGLLPPKIARIMVNLAIGPQIDKQAILLDPFCGSGTILMEAGLLGLRIIGTDQDARQIEGSHRNLSWAGLKNFQLSQCDATHVSSQIKSPVDYIVTEPFLGRPNLRSDQVPRIILGLRKLYLGALKDWLHILKPGGRVVMFMPLIKVNQKTYSASSIIDDPALGRYNVKSKSLIYSRPGAHIQRQLIILGKSRESL